MWHKGVTAGKYGNLDIHPLDNDLHWTLSIAHAAASTIIARVYRRTCIFITFHYYYSQNYDLKNLHLVLKLPSLN